MMILAMRLEMIHELQNTLAEDRYLNLWRTGVGLVGSVFCYYFVFGIGRQGHARIDTPRLVLISFFLLQHSTRAKSWAVGAWGDCGDATRATSERRVIRPQSLMPATMPTTR